MSAKNKQIQLKIVYIYSLVPNISNLDFLHCANSDNRGVCSMFEFTISLFAVSMLHCRWINTKTMQTHLQLFWNRGAQRGCAIRPWWNVSSCHMMVRWEEGVHISKSQTNEREYYPITDTNLGNGCGHNFLFLIIRFAPVWIKHLHGNQYILVLYCILCVLKLKLRYNLTLNLTGEQRVT